ncbi:MAG: hypothetical protein JNL44_04125 [Gemmatimonadetes bacterium]|nr:hypothetical protein [Gemmatimonadota bacterium]
MQDSELFAELEAAANAIDGVQRIPEEEAAALIHELARRHVADPSRHRWWESLRGSAKRVPYGAGDGLAHLLSVVGRRTGVRLFVSNEEQPPWPVYAGDVRSIIAMLGECRFFEYILAPPDLGWVVFDTHMNELIVVDLET